VIDPGGRVRLAERMRTLLIRPSFVKILVEPRRRNRARYLLLFFITIVAGLTSRRFPQVFPALVGKYPGDVLWALMVFFGMGSLFRATSSAKLGLWALGFSFGIESLKLCRASWLANVRHTTLGHLVFGHVFSWQNLVAYTIGVIAGLIIEWLLGVKRRRDAESAEEEA
jgi:hypothetical protein